MEILRSCAVVPAGHEKDVKAFLQIVPLSLKHQVRNFRPVLKLQNACSDHLTFSGCVPILGMETLSRPFLPELRPEA